MCVAGDGGARKSNLWVCAPPKLSVLHHDSEDSVLVQLCGSKRFTLIDPAPLHGLTAYPSLQTVAPLTRAAPGEYSASASCEGAASGEGGAQGDTAARRTVAHFPLVNVTHPDLARHPLFRHARVMVVDVPEVRSDPRLDLPPSAPTTVHDG